MSTETTKPSLRPGAIIKKFFGGDGYPKVDSKELIAFVKGNREGYNWCVDEAAKELGVEVDRSTA